MDERLEMIHRVVSPLSLQCRVPQGRRFIYACVGDRFVSPGQVCRLSDHWERPALRWYIGSHVGAMWSREVRTFVDAALTGAIAAPAPLETTSS